MEDDVKRLKFLLCCAHQYSLKCPQLAAHLTERFTALNSRGAAAWLQWCPRCSTMLTPNSSQWRTLSAKALRSKHKICSRQHIHWLNKPLAKHKTYMIVHCLGCRGSFVAGGLSLEKRRKVADKSHHIKTKTAVVGSSTPVTPSNKRRRSSTLKAHLAKSSVHQRQLDEGASPKLSTFLTSVQ